MSGQGLIWLIVGGVLAYVLIKSSDASYSANPLQNVVPNSLLSKPTTTPPAGQQWQWNGFQWVTVPVGAVAM